MGSIKRVRRSLHLVGPAVAGIVLGHWLTYVLAIPDPGHRAEILAGSGHSYWLLAVKAAVVVGLVGVGCVIADQIRLARGGSRPPESHRSAPGRTLERTALRLATLQILGFTAMEVTERLAAREPVGAMFVHHLFVMGLGVQILVAWGVALFLLWVRKTTIRIVRTLSERDAPLRSLRVQRLPIAPVPARPLLLAGASGLRGPPIL